MINFIIVDDLNFWVNCIEKKINRILFNSKLNYKTYKFNNYNHDFFEMVFTNLENKVYILDSEIKDKDGIDIANKIRSIDKVSEIIFLSSYLRDDVVSKFLISSTKAMAFIDKNRIDILDDKLVEIIKNFTLDKILKINTISKYNLIKIQDILYVETKNRKTIIHTISSVVETSKNLQYIEDRLHDECDFFIRTHRACIVNLNNTISFDFKDKKITFFNNKKCNLLSKSYKSNIKDKINSRY